MSFEADINSMNQLWRKSNNSTPGYRKQLHRMPVYKTMQIILKVVVFTFLRTLPTAFLHAILWICWWVNSGTEGARLRKDRVPLCPEASGRASLVGGKGSASSFYVG